MGRWWCAPRRLRCARRSAPASRPAAAVLRHETALDRVRGRRRVLVPVPAFPRPRVRVRPGGRSAGSAAGAAGLLLDLDFRRADPARLVDESGAARARLSAGERSRLAEVQGVLILRALRGRGVGLPALLCADLDDPAQVQRLEEELRPLTVVPGTEPVARIGDRLRAPA